MESTSSGAIPPQSKASVTVRILTKSERSMAAALLHEVHVKEHGWAVSHFNPSGLRVVCVDGVDQLRDEFDEGAVVFGAFDSSGKLVGTVRAIHRHITGLEIEKYRDIPSSVPRASIEVNRLAVRPDFRKGVAFIKLLAAVVRYADQAGVESIVAAAPFPNPAQVYLKFGMKKLEANGFSYELKDPKEALLLGISIVEAVSSLKTAEGLIKRIENRGHSAVGFGPL